MMKLGTCPRKQPRESDLGRTKKKHQAREYHRDHVNETRCTTTAHGAGLSLPTNQDDNPPRFIPKNNHARMAPTDKALKPCPALERWPMWWRALGGVEGTECCVYTLGQTLIRAYHILCSRRTGFVCAAGRMCAFIMRVRKCTVS
jgi:hypothetical protein